MSMVDYSTSLSRLHNSSRTQNASVKARLSAFFA
jgi:hypothetical protein